MPAYPAPMTITVDGMMEAVSDPDEACQCLALKGSCVPTCAILTDFNGVACLLRSAFLPFRIRAGGNIVAQAFRNQVFRSKIKSVCEVRTFY